MSLVLMSWYARLWQFLLFLLMIYYWSQNFVSLSCIKVLVFLVIILSSHFVCALKCKLNHYLKSRTICEIVITNIYSFMWTCCCIIQSIFSKNITTFETFRGEYHCTSPPEENIMPSWYSRFRFARFPCWKSLRLQESSHGSWHSASVSVEGNQVEAFSMLTCE